MKNTLLLLTAVALAAGVGLAGTPTAQQTSAVQTPEQVIEQFRTDLQTKRADLMAKGLTLTAEQAAKFWPLFQNFEKEQDDIMGAQLKAAQAFTNRADKLSDAEALQYMNALLKRDEQMHDLRVQWLEKFQTAVPPKIAARAIQIDRRLGIATQVGISTQVPLIQ